LRRPGKSRLGHWLARHLDVPFFKLDAEIEWDLGLSLGEIFALSGQSAYRRSERRVLDGALEHYPHFVPAAGGSIVAEAETYEEPLSRYFTIWIKASPEEHMNRVGLSGVDDGIGLGGEPAARGEDASNAPSRPQCIITTGTSAPRSTRCVKPPKIHSRIRL
jgi:hypothetical protein